MTRESSFGYIGEREKESSDSPIQAENQNVEGSSFGPLIERANS